MQLYFCQSHLADVTVYNSCTGVTVKALLLDVPGILLDITKSVSPERSQKTSSHRQFWETLNQIQGNTNEIRTQIGVDRVGHASSRINDECEVKPNVDGLNYVRKLHKMHWFYCRWCKMQQYVKVMFLCILYMHHSKVLKSFWKSFLFTEAAFIWSKIQ